MRTGGEVRFWRKIVLCETIEAVKAYCLAHLDEEGYVKPLQKDIAVALDLTRETVRFAIRDLRTAGVLRHVGHRWERVCQGVEEAMEEEPTRGAQQLRHIER